MLSDDSLSEVNSGNDQMTFQSSFYAVPDTPFALLLAGVLHDRRSR